MNHGYGPWATAMHGGSNPRLSTFWRRRLARLPGVSSSNSPLSSRAIALLGLVSVAIGGVPTLCGWAAPSAPAPPVVAPPAPALPAATPAPPAARAGTEPRFTQTYAVDDVLARIGRERGLSPMDSRVCLVTWLKRGFAHADPVAPAAADRFRLTWNEQQMSVETTAAGHKEVARMLDETRKYGTAEVTVEIRFVTGPVAELAAEARRCALLPSVPPGEDPSAGVFAGLAGWSDGNAGGRSDAQPSGAQSVIERSAPILYGIIDESRAARLLDQTQKSRKANVLQAPRVTLFNGQQALVSDASQTPFVVCFRDDPVRGVVQPRIRVVSEGVRVRLRPVLDDQGKVSLDIQVVFSKIRNVDTVDVTVSPGSQRVSLQVPEVASTRVQGGFELPVGKWLVLDGPENLDPKAGSDPHMVILVRVEPVTPRRL